jgi:hypothetical protein
MLVAAQAISAAAAAAAAAGEWLWCADVSNCQVKQYTGWFHEHCDVGRAGQHPAPHLLHSEITMLSPLLLLLLLH